MPHPDPQKAAWFRKAGALLAVSQITIPTSSSVKSSGGDVSTKAKAKAMWRSVVSSDEVENRYQAILDALDEVHAMGTGKYDPHDIDVMIGRATKVSDLAEVWLREHKSAYDALPPTSKRDKKQNRIYDRYEAIRSAHGSAVAKIAWLNRQRTRLAGVTDLANRASSLTKLAQVVVRLGDPIRIGEVRAQLDQLALDATGWAKSSGTDMSKFIADLRPARNHLNKGLLKAVAEELPKRLEAIGGSVTDAGPERHKELQDLVKSLGELARAIAALPTGDDRTLQRRLDGRLEAVYETTDAVHAQLRKLDALAADRELVQEIKGATAGIEDPNEWLLTASVGDRKTMASLLDRLGSSTLEMEGSGAMDTYGCPWWDMTEMQERTELRNLLGKLGAGSKAVAHIEEGRSMLAGMELDPKSDRGDGLTVPLIDILKLVKDPEKAQLLHAFDEGINRSGENAEFLIALAQDLPRSTIVDRFVKSDAPRKINLPGTLRGKLSGDSATQEDWDKAVQSIRKMMIPTMRAFYSWIEGHERSRLEKELSRFERLGDEGHPATAYPDWVEEIENYREVLDGWLLPDEELSRAYESARDKLVAAYGYVKLLEEPLADLKTKVESMVNTIESAAGQQIKKEMAAKWVADMTVEEMNAAIKLFDAAEAFYARAGVLDATGWLEKTRNVSPLKAANFSVLTKKSRLGFLCAAATIELVTRRRPETLQSMVDDLAELDEPEAPDTTGMEEDEERKALAEHRHNVKVTKQWTYRVYATDKDLWELLRKFEAGVEQGGEATAFLRDLWGGADYETLRKQYVAVPMQINARGIAKYRHEGMPTVREWRSYELAICSLLEKNVVPRFLEWLGVARDDEKE